MPLTHQNNGMYFEEGYAMSLGKTVIQLCKSGTKLYFDIAQKKQVMTKNQLVSAIKQLGFPKELGEQIAKPLESPKAMDRMLSYIYNVKSKSVELVVYEMLAICSEIDAWRDKKASEEADHPEYEIDVKLCAFTALEMEETEHEYEAFKQANQPELINIIGSVSYVFTIWMRKNRSGDGW